MPCLALPFPITQFSVQACVARHPTQFKEFSEAKVEGKEYPWKKGKEKFTGRLLLEATSEQLENTRFDHSLEGNARFIGSVVFESATGYYPPPQNEIPPSSKKTARFLSFTTEQQISVVL
jgi:hypothetical protein